MEGSYDNLPDFDDLPKVKDMPQGCAWGVFDKDGKKDHLGCLNLLTPKVVQEALKEAHEGVSISLNWPIGAIDKPIWGRNRFTHKIISFKEGPLDLHGFDDEVTFNTQDSSQWDSLVHVAHQPTGLSYNGIRPTTGDFETGAGQTGLDAVLPTLDHWHGRGGLVGRGVLLDYRAYTEARGIEYDCFSNHTISVEELENVAAHQDTNLKHGDILIIRSGYTEELEAVSAEEQARRLGTNAAIGVKGNRASARWFWNHHFAAVAGDAPGFEVLPPLSGGKEEEPEDMEGLVLHQYFLSLFGLNIGELWDLKALGAHCKKVGRYEFLLTSVPLNVPGAVGSPANALAIF